MPTPVIDLFVLQRFLDAQDRVYTKVLSELRAGRKTSHWMWFVFPQFVGLGKSDMAQRYAIASLSEARAFAAHPVLGARLRECTECVLQIKDQSIADIFGYPDDHKFHSCMTLFCEAVPEDQIFARALTQFFDCELDLKTIALLI